MLLAGDPGAAPVPLLGGSVRSEGLLMGAVEFHVKPCPVFAPGLTAWTMDYPTNPDRSVGGASNTGRLL